MAQAIASIEKMKADLEARRGSVEGVTEAQDFFDEDRKLTYSCYEPEGKASAWTIAELSFRFLK